MEFIFDGIYILLALLCFTFKCKSIIKTENSESKYTNND
jgi:hypothetical protein